MGIDTFLEQLGSGHSESAILGLLRSLSLPRRAINSATLVAVNRAAWAAAFGLAVQQLFPVP